MITTTSQLTIGADSIDQYGHVNYKAALPLFGPSQDKLLAERGTSFDAIEQIHGLRSFVKKAEVTWHSELRQGDECTVVTSLELGNTSMKFHQMLYVVRGRPAVELFMVVVLVSLVGEPASIPPQLREQLS